MEKMSPHPGDVIGKTLVSSGNELTLKSWLSLAGTGLHQELKAELESMYPQWAEELETYPQMTEEELEEMLHGE
jgi:hypothetical protein